jgi:predicted transcriptional regulator
MVEIMLALLGVLLSVTIVAAVEYYKRLRQAQREYEKARDSVEDVVLSFNRQLKREAERVELVAYKIGEIASKEDRALNTAMDVEKQFHELEAKIGTVEDRQQLAARFDVMDKRLSDVAVSHEALSNKITGIEEQTKQLAVTSEANVEAVIPIKRDRAIAQLTETELAALDYLASDGAKTAPEIKQKVQLSREHTARLMKKLYEEGYLERDTSKIPFKYSIKKEMEKFLKKTESQSLQ